MKYKVIGAQKDTGDDVAVELLAITKAEAERIAHEKGIMVSSVEEIVHHEDLDSIPLEPEEVGHAGTATATATAVAMAPAAVRGNGGHAHVEVHAADAHAPAHQEPHHEAHHDPEKHEPHHPDAHMEYKLLQNQALFLLEKTVNKFLADGWEPQGGLTIQTVNNAPNYFQAIVRRKQEE